MNKIAMVLDVPDPEVALAALAPDDAGFIASRIEDGKLIIEAESQSVMGVLRSIDDVLGCLRATGIE